MVKIGDGFFHLPFLLIPFAGIVGDASELEEGDVFHEAGIMEGGAFHGFYGGIEAVGIAKDGFFGGTDLVDGDGGDFFQAAFPEQIFVWVYEPAILIGKLIGLHQPQIEKGEQCFLFYHALVGDGVFSNHGYFPQFDGRVEASADTGLDHELRSFYGNLLLQVIGGGGEADAGDEHVQFQRTGTRGVLLAIPFQEGSYFERRGGGEETGHLV